MRYFRYLILGVVIGLGVWGYFYWQSQQAKPQIARVQPLPSEPPAAPIGPRYPVGQPSLSAGTPPSATPNSVQDSAELDEKEPTIAQLLLSLLKRRDFKELFNVEGVVRRLVVTVDDASTRVIPPNFLPFRPIQTPFEVKDGTEGPTLSPENYARYKPYVDALVSIDTDQAVAIYSRYYSLFQSAYNELGIEGYFNDRLVSLIDECLEMKLPEGPIALVKGAVHYKFADPELEKLSAAQRFLVRMGNANASLLRIKLRELRQRIVHLNR